MQTEHNLQKYVLSKSNEKYAQQKLVVYKLQILPINRPMTSIFFTKPKPNNFPQGHSSFALNRQLQDKMQEKSTTVISPYNALSTYSNACKEEDLEQSLISVGFGSISSSKNGKFPVGKRNGIWTLVESEKYKNFLKRHRTIFLEHRLRRRNQIFVMMSKKLKSREPLQCRSHHQKMLKKHRTIDQIISHFEDKLKTAREELNFEKAQQSMVCEKKQEFYSMGTICNKIRIIIKEEYVGCYQLEEQ